MSSSSSTTTTCTDVPAAASEQLCYIHCNFCNIVLAVSVPCSSLFDTVTVRCGNCSNMWPVNVGIQQTTTAFHHQSLTTASPNSTLPAAADPSPSHHPQPQQGPNHITDLGFSLDRNNKMPVTMRPRPLHSVNNAQEINTNRPQEKRQRVPSLYNRFIKEEIQRIKASNPDISHKEAFSTAAKNWAHFPHIQFGLTCSRTTNHLVNQDDQNEGLRYSPSDKA